MATPEPSPSLGAAAMSASELLSRMPRRDLRPVGRRRAVVIGVNKYEARGAVDLTGGDDARRVALRLAHLGFDEVICLHDADPLTAPAGCKDIPGPPLRAPTRNAIVHAIEMELCAEGRMAAPVRRCGRASDGITSATFVSAADRRGAGAGAAAVLGTSAGPGRGAGTGAGTKGTGDPRDDLLLVYFAGHGALIRSRCRPGTSPGSLGTPADVARVPALLPCDVGDVQLHRALGEAGANAGGFIERSWVVEQLRRASRRSICIIDACHQGVDVGSRYRGGLAADPLEFDMAAEGFGLLAASTRGQEAEDGVFTRALLQALDLRKVPREPGAIDEDEDEDTVPERLCARADMQMKGWVTLPDIASYVEHMVGTGAAGGFAPWQQPTRIVQGFGNLVVADTRPHAEGCEVEFRSPASGAVWEEGVIASVEVEPRTDAPGHLAYEYTVQRLSSHPPFVTSLRPEHVRRPRARGAP